MLGVGKEASIASCSISWALMGDAEFERDGLAHGLLQVFVKQDSVCT